MPSIRAAALTDIGRVRQENEDRYLCDADALLFAVADGVGGLPGGGEAASQALAEVVTEFNAARPGETPDLVRIVQGANAAVARLGMTISPGLGIGTTLTLGCVRDGALKLAHVGDSRCYFGRRNELIRLTEDHSVENEARIRRARGEVIYYHEANRHALTRCIGQPSPVKVDLITRGLAAGDRFLFCSDGVTRMLTEEEIGEMVFGHGEPESGLQEIIAGAIAHGGLDNATAVLVFVDEPV